MLTPVGRESPVFHYGAATPSPLINQYLIPETINYLNNPKSEDKVMLSQRLRTSVEAPRNTFP